MVVSDLRLGVLGAIGGAVTDAVICGENRDRIGALFYPNPTLDRAAIAEAVRAGVAAFNARAKGAGSRIARAMVLPGPPDAHAGEITDKGYIAQAIARTLRAEAVERLFAVPVPADVMEFE